MKDIVLSLIRTYVPVAVGGVIAWLAVRGLNLRSIEPAAITGLTSAVTAAYYTAARLLEQKFPWLGFLLGHVAKPAYHWQPSIPVRPSKASYPHQG